MRSLESLLAAALCTTMLVVGCETAKNKSPQAKDPVVQEQIGLEDTLHIAYRTSGNMLSMPVIMVDNVVDEKIITLCSPDLSERYRVGPGTHPIWAHDGNRIAFNSDSTLLVYNFTTHKVFGLTHSGSKPVWSPDDQHIVYQRDSAMFLFDFADTSDYYLTEGTEPDWVNANMFLFRRNKTVWYLKLAEHSYQPHVADISSSALSLDHRWIAYLRSGDVLAADHGSPYGPTVTVTDVFIGDFATGEANKVYSHRTTYAKKEGLLLQRPLWSTNGEKIVFYSSIAMDVPVQGSTKKAQGVISNIYVYDTQKSEVREVASQLVNVLQVNWLPDNTTLAISRIKPGIVPSDYQPELLLINTQTGKRTVTTGYDVDVYVPLVH